MEKSIETALRERFADLYRRAKAIAALQGKSLQVWLREAVEEKLEKEETQWKG